MSNRVAVVEVTKAVARADPGAVLEPFFETFSFVELDAELALIAGTTGNAGSRALDAIHVASALRLGPEVEIFVTYDARQAAAAAAAGLRIASPGVAGDVPE